MGNVMNLVGIYPSTQPVTYLPIHPHFRSILGKEELAKLKTAVENENGVIQHSYGRDDSRGRRTCVSLWDHPGSDVTGYLARCEKVAGTMEQVCTPSLKGPFCNPNMIFL